MTPASASQGVISGKLITLLCAGTVPTQHTIVSTFTAQYTRTANALQLTGGFIFSPTESTGTFRDLQGGGRIEGRITCLSAPSCAERGVFTDFVASTGDPTLGPGLLQPGVVGTYYDPTVTTGSSG